MCHRRPMIERFEEHLAFIQSPHTAEYKYKAMRGLGGASSWFLVPIAIAPGVVPLGELKRREQQLIGSNPHSWNSENRYRGRCRADLVAAKGSSTKTRPSRSTRAGSARSRGPESLVLWGRAITPNGERIVCSASELLTHDVALWHSSMSRCISQTVLRRYRKSEVKLFLPATRSARAWTLKGTLKEAIRLLRKHRDTWVGLTFVT